MAKLLKSYKGLGCKNVTEDTLFAFTSKFLTTEQVMSMGNDSTRTLQLWRKDVRESGIHLCSLTTAGMWLGMTLLLSIRDKPKSVVQILNKGNFVVLSDTLVSFS